MGSLARDKNGHLREAGPMLVKLEGYSASLPRKTLSVLNQACRKVLRPSVQRERDELGRQTTETCRVRKTATLFPDIPVSVSVFHKLYFTSLDYILM